MVEVGCKLMVCSWSEGSQPARRGRQSKTGHAHAFRRCRINPVLCLFAFLMGLDCTLNPQGADCIRNTS